LNPQRGIAIDIDHRDSGALQAPVRVTTRGRLPYAPEHVWRSLMFYEQIVAPPPFYLRVLLPLPVRSEGAKEGVGDVATCVYASGHLLKRVTRIEPARLYEFAVVEQKLSIGAGLRLSGGSYALQPLPQGATEVAVTTDYLGGRRPRALWRRGEAMVCHLFHRHLLGAIASKAADTAPLARGIAREADTVA
jgi:hypothetical protein